MKKNIKFKAILSKESPILEAIAMLNESDDNNGIAGIVIVVDRSNQVIGVLTDGDIRRGLCRNLSLSSKIDQFYNKDPITVVRNNSNQMKNDFVRKIKQNNCIVRGKFKTDKIIVTDKNGIFDDVILYSDLLQINVFEKSIAVHGMGFVGLTLSVVLANKGFIVSGIDVNEDVVSKLKNNIVHFYEKGLDSLLEKVNTQKSIEFKTHEKLSNYDIHIVAVGTPLCENNIPNMDFIVNVTESIKNVLKHGDLVIYRSTVPVGTTRNLLIPILEQSGLKVSVDFNVAFAPERTVEGKAIEELQQLPQIIGGLTAACCKKASSLFKQITHNIVEVSSLESAELIKLMNNTFRDLVFSFSNEVSSICDNYNINCYDLINSANEGYPRNKIPSPSPGVGGICLAKDPYLYSEALTYNNQHPVLGRASREINSSGFKHVYEKIVKYTSRNNLDINSIKIYLIGLAFKGLPETSDIRESMALKLINMLPVKKNIFIKDFVVDPDTIIGTGCNYVDKVEDGFVNSHVVLIMNNHHLNSKFDLYKVLNKAKSGVLFFDGWNMFRSHEIVGINNAIYSTLGYMSNN